MHWRPVRAVAVAASLGYSAAADPARKGLPMTDIKADDWDGEMGARWLAHLDRFEGMIEPIGTALLAHAAFSPGERVIDIGCGAGANSIDVARLVAPDGAVTGIDIAPMLVDVARERASLAGMGNVDFMVADAQRAMPGAAPVDRLFSRFGVMFFDDSDAAFANLRGWLSPGGRIDFACWAAPDLNRWIAVAGAVVAQHAELPVRDPDGPGPFRFANPDATRAMLERAGFTDVTMQLHTGEQCLAGPGSTPEGAADFLFSAMSMGKALADLDPGLPDRVRADVIDALRPYHRDGAVRMPGAAWLVSARNPG